MFITESLTNKLITSNLPVESDSDVPKLLQVEVKFIYNIIMLIFRTEVQIKLKIDST